MILVPNLNFKGLALTYQSSQTIIFLVGISIIFAIKAISKITTTRDIFSIYLNSLDITLLLGFIYININKFFIHNQAYFSLTYIDLIALSSSYVIFRNLNNRERIFLCLFIIIGALFQSIIGYLQYIKVLKAAGVYHLSGNFFNPNLYAIYLALGTCFSLYFFLFHKQLISAYNIGTKYDRYLSNFFFLTSLLNLLVIILSFSRTAILGIVLAAFLLVFFRYRTTLPHYCKFLSLSTFYKKLLYMGLTLLVIVVAIGLYIVKKDSADGRLLIWKVAKEKLLVANYCFGYGFDTFKSVYMEGQYDYFKTNRNIQEVNLADNTYYAFNEILQQFIENGIIGIIFLLTVIYLVVLGLVLNRTDILKYLCIAILTVFGCACMFSYPLQILPIKLIVVFIFSFPSLQYGSKMAIKINSKYKNSVFSKLLACMVCGGVALLFGMLALKTSFSNKNWNTANDLYQDEQYEEACYNYHLAYPDLSSDGEFLLNFGKALHLAGDDHQALLMLEQARKFLNNQLVEITIGDVYYKLKNIEAAKKSYIRAAHMVPNRFLPHYLLANIYFNEGDYDKFKDEAEIILRKKIKIQSLAITEMRKEMREKLKIIHSKP